MIIIQGSARTKGNTAKVGAYLCQEYNMSMLHLQDYNLLPFSYDGPADDRFEKIVTELVKHESIVLMSPIYWYTMSGQMKIFLDRITDLLRWNKELGRQLRGKKMYVVSSSESDDAPEEYAYPFELSAGYLGMEYKGYAHTWVEEGEIAGESLERMGGVFG